MQTLILFKKFPTRPFDAKFIYYDVKIIERARYKVMKHFLQGTNLGLVTARSNKSETCDHFYISKNIMETKCGENNSISNIPTIPLPENQHPTNHWPINRKNPKPKRRNRKTNSE